MGIGRRCCPCRRSRLLLVFPPVVILPDAHNDGAEFEEPVAFVPVRVVHVTSEGSELAEREFPRRRALKFRIPVFQHMGRMTLASGQHT